MKIWSSLATLTLGLSLLTSGPALAQKPDSAVHSGARSIHHEQSRNHDKNVYTSYFDQNRSKRISDYYRNQAKKSGHCPPGLAKKNNRCQPPGQAKKWTKGRPLPANVVYHNLPRDLLYELGGTPAGQKVVRVGEDILLINAVTGLVIDAIEHVFQ